MPATRMPIPATQMPADAFACHADARYADADTTRMPIPATQMPATRMLMPMPAPTTPQLQVHLNASPVGSY
ncbi:hypothetical protein K503DRAFT_774801, partial [Rhizopogon vinicolor AM-OR11-026]